MKLLTVTVPCYNSQDYLEGCIDSLLVGGERVEIIIINDGSKDATGEIADRYAEKYPDTVKVVHQENGGHGEGINQGLKRASGIYFKVVDSDDRVSEDFPAFLDKLEEYEAQGGVDIAVTNYYYVHSDGVGDRSINYSDVLPEGKILEWRDTRPFKIHQLLTIHSATFRTDVMRASGKQLPKHTFYEDNYMITHPLPYIKRLCYMNMDLYRYTIGREGQSVQADIIVKRYAHQNVVTELCFKAMHINEIEDKRLRRYVKHEIFMMLAISSLVTRQNNSKESDADLKAMWNGCREFDKKQMRRFRYGTVLLFLNVPGPVGRWFCRVIYKLANKVVRFN